MALLDDLASGTLGLVVRPPDHLVVTEQSPASATLRDERQPVGWWFYWYPDLHLALEPAASLERDIQRHTRFLFDAMFVADGKAQPRTTDANWSPVIEIERLALDGGSALSVLHRMQYQPTREVIMGHTLVPTAHGLFEARWFSRAQMTGMRESAMMFVLNPDGPPKFAGQAAYDDPKYDDKFPTHVLSIVRRAKRWYSDGELRITSAPPAAPREVRLDPLGCTITVPERFVREVVTAEDGVLARVSFSGVDGVDRVIVTRTTETIRGPEVEDRLAKLAERRAREICEQSGLVAITCEPHGELLVTEGDSPPPGYGRARAGWRWFLDDRGCAWSISLATTVAVPTGELVAEVAGIARSWVPNR